MKYEIFGKNLKVTDGMRNAIESALQKYDTYFPENTKATIKMSVVHAEHICEITVPYCKAIVRVEQRSGDMYTSIKLATDKLARRMRKHKTKIEKMWKSSEDSEYNIPSLEEELESKVVKTKRFELKPMPVEEAILQMQMLGHTFYVFLDEDTGMVSVVYLRKDGEIGLIETDK